MIKGLRYDLQNEVKGCITIQHEDCKTKRQVRIICNKHEKQLHKEHYTVLAKTSLINLEYIEYMLQDKQFR